jgi:excisionase family DNA binding protein
MTSKFFNGEVELLKVMDIAKNVQVHPGTILRYIREKKLKTRKIGRSYFVSKENFKKYIDGS